MSMQNSQPDTFTPETAPTVPWWRRFLQPPAGLEDLGDQRQAQLLLGLSITFFFTTLIGAFFGDSELELSLLAASAFVAVWFSRTRYYQLGSALIIAILTGVTLTRTVSDLDSPIFFMPLTFILASVLLPYRYAAGAIIFNIVGLFVLPVVSPLDYGDDFGRFAGTLSVLGLLFIYSTFFRNSLERERLKRLRDANESLETLRADLDNQVQDRTAELALAADVGRSLSQVRALDVLLQDASELIRERFNLYHVQIYLTDSSQRTLVLRAGTGRAASELIKRRHSLGISPDSINGNAALTKKPVIVVNARESSLFRPNLLLPNTRSEMAIPLLIGERVLGVLDLQSTEVNGLSARILPAFETVASQLAISIDNANLFTAANEAQAEVEAYLQRLAREGWSAYLDGLNRQERLAYVYETDDAAAASTGGITPARAGKNSLELPITVANQSIGAIQVDAEAGRHWTEETRAVVASVAQQVAQQLENLRLLDEAQQYRLEAEKAVQQLSHEAWQLYEEDLTLPGFVYDGTAVKPLTAAGSPAGETVNLPLEIHGETIGQLMLTGLPVMDEETHALLTNVSQYLTEHLENLRLTRQTEEALNTTERLYQIGSALNAATNVQEVLEAAVSPVQAGLRESTLMFVELDRRGEPQILEMLADWRPAGDPSFPIGTRFPLSQFPFTGLFMGNPQEPQFIGNTAEDARVDEFTRNVMLQVGIQAIVIVPLTISGQWVGILTFSWGEPQTFDRQLREYFNALINMAAPVVQSQRLFARTRVQADKERLINVINQRIQGTVSVESALQTAVAELGKALNAGNAKVELGLPQENNDPAATNGSNGKVTA